VLLKRGVVAFVLVGYVLAFSVSSTGHGWWMLGHVLGEHDPVGVLPHREALVEAHEEGHHDGEAHHHGAVAHEEARHAPELPHPSAVVHHHAGGDHEHVAPPDASADADWTLHAAHAHNGQVHTHDGEERPAPAQRVIEIDKHCAISGLPAPVPPAAREQAFGSPWAAQSCSLRPVETPPPRRTA